jgi:hypothetical protein
MYASLILLAFSALEKGIELLAKLRAAAKQSGEWTPEQENEFQEKLELITSQDHWQIQP